MKFTQIEITNFLAIGAAKFALDGLGLVHISGQNLDETSADSNGSGKSSIADAISWCLWGSTARGLSGDEVVNTAAGKDCYVGITIDDEGDVYEVRRYRKAKKHRNALQLFRLDDKGEWEDLTKGTNSLTQNAVERLLGQSEDVFNAAHYFGQESIPDIPRMTDKQLKTLVEQAAGVDVLTNAYDIARTRFREVAEKRAQAQIDLDRAVQRHTDATASLMRLSDEKTQWDAQHAVNVANLKTKTTQAVAAFKKAEAELDTEAEDDLKTGIKECQDKIASVNEERQRETMLDGEFATAKQNLSKAETALAIVERQGREHVVDAGLLQDELKAIEQGSAGECKSCGREFDESHKQKHIDAVKKKIEAKKADLTKVAGEIKAAKQKVQIARQIVENAAKDLDEHRKSMTDVSAEGDRLQNLQRELQLIAAHRTEVERIRQQAIRIGAEYKKEAALDNPFVPLIDQTDAEIQALSIKRDVSAQIRDEALQEELYAGAVVDVFAPNGVRAHRLDEATPFLNERTAHYLGSLADGAIDAYWTTVSETKSKDRLVEKFSVTVEKAGSAPSFNALSGGEKRKVRLACALALQDLVATRAAKSIELWIGDEVDEALDNAGLERLMGVLEEKARERGTVLCISHNDISSYIRTHWTVRKENGQAKVITV